MESATETDAMQWSAIARDNRAAARTWPSGTVAVAVVVVVAVSSRKRLEAMMPADKAVA